jgi:hypothetical protein
MSCCSPQVHLAKKGAKAPLPEPYWLRFLWADYQTTW